MGSVVDVVIAVHTPERPIERAVASVLENECDVRVLVVVHNTEVDPIRDRLGVLAADPRVTLLEFNDGVKSPAGPMNYGFDQASAPWVSLVGSDDALEPGALDQWLALAKKHRAGVVIAPIRFNHGAVFSYPPVRPGWLFGRERVCDPVLDRLSYRVAPLGLVSREALADYRLETGLATGEDQPLSLRLWFSNRVVFAPRSRCYVGFEDQTDRVTYASRSFTEDLAVVSLLLDPKMPYFGSRASRVAVFSQVLRQVVGNTVLLRSGEQLEGDEFLELQRVTRLVVAAEPSVLRVLSRAEAQFVGGIVSGEVRGDSLHKLATAAAQFKSLNSLITANPRYLLHRQAPLRLHIAQFFVARFGR